MGFLRALKNAIYTKVDRTTASALTSDASSGQKDVEVSDGTKFSTNEQVTIRERSGDRVSETNTISSISGNTLTMTNNLSNTYEIADDAYVEVKTNFKSNLNAGPFHLNHPSGTATVNDCPYAEYEIVVNDHILQFGDNIPAGSRLYIRFRIYSQSNVTTEVENLHEYLNDIFMDDPVIYIEDESPGRGWSNFEVRARPPSIIPQDESGVYQLIAEYEGIDFR